MADPSDVGRLDSTDPGLEDQILATFQGTMTFPGNPGRSDREVMDAAVEEQKITPSVWFANFPPSLNPQQEAVLRQYMDSILTYRSWASIIWRTPLPTAGCQRITAQIQWLAAVHSLPILLSIT